MALYLLSRASRFVLDLAVSLVESNRLFLVLASVSWPSSLCLHQETRAKSSRRD